MHRKREGFEIIRVGIILFIITAVAALILAMVNNVTAPIIAEQESLKMEEAMTEVLPDANTFEEVPLELSEDLSLTRIYESDAGFVVFASPKGYGGEISMAVGIDKELKVTGISIISQGETAGLGAKCTEPEWQKQFIGKTENIEVSKNGAKGNQIDAISSATITSKAVTRGVNEALAAVKIIGGDE
ncbi:MAG: RnfABCDGE type electron transport complex subunit G [Firmicutes bacterium]|nr:RnfABCDGE type electron transport complex subunit G [Bacillota bacterium]